MSHRDMGNVTLARETSRAVWIGAWVDGLRQDVRYAFRSLRAQPGFTIAAGTVLVLGNLQTIRLSPRRPSEKDMRLFCTIRHGPGAVEAERCRVDV